MPERLNICCKFATSPTDRAAVFDRLFEIDAPLMGAPAEAMLFDIGSGSTTKLPWPLPERVIKQSLRGYLLFVYGAFRSPGTNDRSCIELEEAGGKAVYTLSFPASWLRTVSLQELEKRFTVIYRVAASVSRCTLLIGPELEVGPNLKDRELWGAEPESGSLVAWIVGDECQLPTKLESFQLSTQHDGVAIWRNPRAADRLKFC